MQCCSHLQQSTQQYCQLQTQHEMLCLGTLRYFILSSIIDDSSYTSDCLVCVTEYCWASFCRFRDTVQTLRVQRVLPVTGSLVQWVPCKRKLCSTSWLCTEMSYCSSFPCFGLFLFRHSGYWGTSFKYVERYCHVHIIHIYSLDPGWEI